MRPSSGSPQELAAAIRRRAVQAGQDDPSVRGVSRRQATVTTVNADGTVTTTEGVIARRLETYELPAVADSIVITQSPSGDWFTEGRWVATTGDGWQTPTLNSPWAAYSGGGTFRAPRFRRVGGEVIIEGLADTGGTSVSGNQTVFTLPVGYRPDSGYIFAAQQGAATARQLSILTTGVVQVSALPVGAVGFLTLNCRFSLT